MYSRLRLCIRWFGLVQCSGYAPELTASEANGSCEAYSSNGSWLSCCRIDLSSAKPFFGWLGRSPNKASQVGMAQSVLSIHLLAASDLYDNSLEGVRPDFLARQIPQLSLAPLDQLSAGNHFFGGNIPVPGMGEGRL